ncbi:DUF2079 domain-containing protein, partial [Patescibacteria group bacterium]|nr:DUF2079 domain-containing protein [Patescibacteria group bacterium]
MQPTSTTPVARDDSPEPRLLAIINRHAILILVGLSALAVVFYAALSIAPYATYRSNAFDLGIFNQAIYHYAHLQPATSTIRGVNNLLGDHFELL